MEGGTYPGDREFTLEQVNQTVHTSCGLTEEREDRGEMRSPVLPEVTPRVVYVCTGQLALCCGFPCGGAVDAVCSVHIC